MNDPTMARRSARLLLLPWVVGLGACAAAAPAPATPVVGIADAERRTATYLEAIRDDPPLLTAFVRALPKGGDLHSHLGGTSYAEYWLAWAAEDRSCVSRRELRIIVAPCTPTPDTVRAADALADPELHGALVDALSMRNWQPSRVSGHDQFFATFSRFGALPHRTADQLAEAMTRAANGGVRYLELMISADGLAAWGTADRAGWTDDFATMRDTLLALGLNRVVADARARLDRVEARRDSLLGCGTARAADGCGVTVRWLFQVLRAQAPERVFAHTLTGFLLADRDPRVVGVNLVQPEDWPIAMRDYSLHMRMIAYLRSIHPRVPVALHAGELAPGLVPPEGLRFHVREAIEVAGARRIGHGVSVMHEPDPHGLLRTMAERGVLIEINLTSNDVILGVRGRDHPLRAYVAAGVPVALSTDDEGVARSEMSMEHLRAVREQGLDYATLKRMARNSLEFAFVEGASLWRDARYLEPVPACAGDAPAAACAEFLDGSAKARLQQRLEQDFAAFEAGIVRGR